MSYREQQAAARKFVDYWSNPARGREKSEDQTFWNDLYQNVLGVSDTKRLLYYRKPVRKGAERREADMFNEEASVLVEHKSRGTDLDKPEERGKNPDGTKRMVTPYEQARWYANYMTPMEIRPRYLITCNFDEFRVYDCNDEDAENHPMIFMLEELPEKLKDLGFLVKKEDSRLEREKKLNLEAGAIVGRLYDVLISQYHNYDTEEKEQKSLNILITRLVFLLFAEDAMLLHRRDAFYHYLKGTPADLMANRLRELFLVLKTPMDERDSLYVSSAAKEFSYVNGGLFAEDIIIPEFTEEACQILLNEASAKFDWSNISPTIFGAVFESTLNTKTRRESGVHFTSVEYIHRVIDPLFLDDLKDELVRIEQNNVLSARNRLLIRFRKKIASINVLDAASGSGNFLTETYRSLRKLENRVLTDLLEGGQILEDLEDVNVSISQFYGIETNDFAVEVAKTALWIAELQMLDETMNVLDKDIPQLPLKNNKNIWCVNALRTDWNDIIPAQQCDYVIGNPPFVGYSRLDDDQREDRKIVFNGGGGNLDYVACWFELASRYIEQSGNKTKVGLVSTNSICQGQQVEPVWRHIFEERGQEIYFAWLSFKWNINSIIGQAQVTVIIVGFGAAQSAPKKILSVDRAPLQAAHINGYLMPASDIWVSKRTTPLCPDAPIMVSGLKPADHNWLLLDTSELEELKRVEPESLKYVRRFLDADAILRNKSRYCLWLVDADLYGLQANHPWVYHRVQELYQWRCKQTKTGDAYKLRNDMGLMRAAKTINIDCNFLSFPGISSENRSYIAAEFVTDGAVPGNRVFFVPNASLYDFGIFMSQTHNAWMRAVGGKMETRYSYVNTIVYNNFPWPEPIDERSRYIEMCAQEVLDVRASYDGDLLADMYDGISPMPENPSKADLKKYDQRKYDDLRDAHLKLDRAVEAAYGVDFNGDENKIVEHLFKLYREKIAELDE